VKDRRPANIGHIAIDAQLVRALGHPTRIQIVAEINKPGRVISPKEFADDNLLTLSNVSYHFRALADIGCITLVETKPVRGSTQDFYKASKRMLFDVEEWAAMPAIFKSSVAARVFSDYLKTAREAVEAGTFDDRDDAHVTWATMRIDERGWGAGAAILTEALEKLLALEEECAPRIAEGAEALDATFGIGFFESPRHDSD
jgi:DNA-binding transcriptional ArsR family regulator